MTSILQILAVSSDKEESLGLYILGESCIFGHPIKDASSCNEVDWRIKFSYFPFVQDQDPSQKRKRSKVSISLD